MSSIPGLPTRGSDVTVLITRVHLHPLCVLVEFWGNFSLHRATDYELLANEIQTHGALFKDQEGNPGDQCLVHIDGTWYRARIVSRDGSRYSVFLMDRGMTYTAATNELAWGKKEHFKLPPEVELCILANVLPLSPENRWSPVAFEFLKSFTGRLVDARVQDVLVSDRMFLLTIPCISNPMYEMGFAKKLSPATFKDFLLESLKSISTEEVLTEVQKLDVASSEQLQNPKLFMYPELIRGTVETVIVTEVTNPQQIFCQLKVFSHELKKVTENVTQSCESKVYSCIKSPDVIGYPCAARGRDGRWYRSVIQQVFAMDKVVEVLNVDYGTKQLVQMKNVRPLTAEFFRMPVVTYVCSLHGICDKRTEWTPSEVDFLKSLLLHKTVIARFEYKHFSEEVYYVTLYGDDNINMNSLFGSKNNRFLQHEETLEPGQVCSIQHSAKPVRKAVLSHQPVEKQEKTTLSDEVHAEDLALNSSYLAVVQHVSNPSEFWIQTDNYKNDLEELLDNIYHLYHDSENTHVVKNPTLGLYCAAEAQDGEFYRAAVTEVAETHIKVFFVDYGNTEVVEKTKIRALPPEFKKIPQLGFKCSLASVRSKYGQWSQSAVEYFIKAVTDKTLNVHVRGKYSDRYVVELTDTEALGEQDVATQMCTNGFAERTEIPRQSTLEGAIKPSLISPARLPEAGLPEVRKGSGTSFKHMFGFSNKERKVGTFKEQMFPIGSVLDVNVSCIESPNDFWCQLVQNAQSLRLLMEDMQAYYASSEFEPNVSAACVALHPDNKMWYRALVIRKHETPQVDVLFVDFGQTETVSLFDLRRINPEFLKVHGQAFRCSLLNVNSPISTISEWSCKAKEMFKNFVESAASNFIILKCTIYAIMCSDQMVVHNIVDLETPFESICASLADLITSIPPKKATGASFRLDTYYYSTHNIKMGTEENIRVVFVNSVGEFYCHLDKNADVMKDLKVKVNTLCQQLEKIKVPSVFGTLCFARHTDGQWYRAQIKATKPKLLVHFVDYGDTLQVDRSDLLPVPKEANDIMSVPVQAVVCALSDVPADVPREVNEWFEKTATECQFRALIVARKDDGKLQVELYHGHTQINARIKKTFQIDMQEEQVVYQSWKPQDSANPSKTEKDFSNRGINSKDHEQAPKKNNSTPKHSRLSEFEGNATDENLRTSFNSEGPRLRPRSSHQQNKPHQSQPNRARPKDGSEEPNAESIPEKVNLNSETKLFISGSSCRESSEEKTAEKRAKLTDLPSKCITSGTVVDVYVSHCDSPLNFCVQRVSEEDELFSLVERLNDPNSTSKATTIKDFHPGDLVKAEFADDFSWYRAVVKETHENAMALVEFIDFGNTGMTAISKMEELSKSFLELPVYCTHCMLSEAAVLGEENVLNPHVVSGFKENISRCGDKVLKCQFIKQVGSVWEVSLQYNGMDIGCKVSKESSDITIENVVNEQQVEPCDMKQEEKYSEKPPSDPLIPGYPHRKEALEGQQLEVYVTTVNENQSFWCQSVDSKELCQITLGVSEVGNAADQYINPDVVFLGMPCVALFADDQLWYRAEVVDKNQDELSVFFVDYGNMSKVNISDIKAAPPALLEVPTQAFLCELEGFDTSCGSWRDGATDELSTLTADKLVQLTVTRVTRTDGKLKCVVELECEGQEINKAMSTFWKCLTTTEVPNSGGETVSFEPPEHLDAANTIQHPPKLDVQTGSNATSIMPQSGYSEEHRSEELTPFPTEHRVLNLVTSSKQIDCSGDSSIVESSVEIANEQDFSEGVIMVPMMPLTDILASGSGIDEALQLSADQKNVTLATGEGDVEETALVLHAVEPDDEPSLGDDAADASDEQETETSETGKLISTSSDMDPFNDLAMVTDERTVGATQDPSQRNVDLEENVSEETTDTKLDSPNQTELAPPSPTAFVQLSEQEPEPGDGTVHEGRTCISTDVKGEDPYELQETHPAVSEEPSNEKSAETEDLSHAMDSEGNVGPLINDKLCDKPATAEESEEVQQDLVVCSVSVRSVSGSTADVPQHAEVLNTPSPDKDSSLFEDHTFTSNVDVEPQIHTGVNLVETLTCLVRDNDVADVSQDSEQEPEMSTEEKSEQTHSLHKAFDDSAEEQLLSAEDSFEAQLSKITHLTLIVRDGDADVFAEQQPEE